MSVFKNDRKRDVNVEMAVTDRLRSLQREINGLRSEQESFRKNMVVALSALSERVEIDKVKQQTDDESMQNIIKKLLGIMAEKAQLVVQKKMVTKLGELNERLSKLEAGVGAK